MHNYTLITEMEKLATELEEAAAKESLTPNDKVASDSTNKGSEYIDSLVRAMGLEE